MADRIRGITIEIGGDTTGLSNALKGVNSNIKSTQSQLKDVERLLKLDPSNTELLSQKQRLLTQAVNETKEKLETLKEANRQAAESASRYDEWKTKYDPIKTQIDETKRKLDELKAQSKNADEQLANGEISQEKYDALQEEIKQTSQDLETLKDEAKEVSDEFGNPISPEQYEALQREIIETEQNLRDLEEQADQSNVALQKIGVAGEKIKEFGGKVTAVGQELSKVSAGLAAVGTAAVAAWETVDDAYDTIAKGTGATGEALEGLQESFDNVFSSIPTDAATAGSAIADINTRFGFTGEAVEECTRKFIQFGEVNGTDVSTAIANVSRYMGDAGIESSKYSEVLDQLTAASQGSGLSVDKLSESLTKYGAPMRALGFETQESIAIFAGWEKAGVNTEIAFSGMKKAIGTWGKEGKDARKEFKKTLDEIAACPDIAEATSKAIEVFGQKAGPDLADAIQGGRFAYEDFLQIVENSQGQLEQTFNDTLDPIDDVKVAMQGLTAQGAELGGALLETLAPMITKLIDKIKELTTWFKGLDDSQKEMVVKVGLLVAALGPMLIVIGQITTGVGGLMTMVSTIGPAIGALGAAGGPILLTVAAFGLLAGAVYDAQSRTSEYYQAANDLTEQEAENKTKVEDLYGAYDQMNQRRADAAAAADTEALKEQALFDELQSITDENGNVKAGYEERAKYILGELSTALGQEYEMTGNQIKNYKDMCASIDDLIVKKQANALLSANEAAYTEALKNQTDAFMAYNAAQKSAEETKHKLAEAQRQEARYQMELNALWAQSAETGADVTYAASEVNDKMIAASEAAKGYVDKMSGLNQTLANAETAYVGYNTTIANYEGLSSAIISGDQLKISEAVLMASNSFQTAETATRESLERQVQTLTEKYQAMKEAVDAGAPGITQTQVEQMKSLVDRSKAELDRLPDVVGGAADSSIQSLTRKAEALKAAGQRVGSDYSAGSAQGIRDGQADIEAAAAEVSNAGVNASRTALDSHSPSRVTHDIGLDYDAGFAGGIMEGITQVTDAVTQVTTAATTTLDTQLQQSNTATQTYQAGMSLSWTTWAAALVSAITTSLSNIGLGVNTQLLNMKTSFTTETTAITTDWTVKWTSIETKHKNTMKNIKELTTQVLSAIKTLSRSETTQMKTDSITTMNQMVVGIDEELKKLEPTVKNNFEPAVKYITDLIPKARIWGNDMMDGFIQGIRDKMDELEDACEDVADTVSDYLHFTRPEKGPLRYYEEWMPHMMQGLAKGLRDNRNLITEQIQNLTADMSALQMDGQQMKQPVNLTSYNVIALDGKQVAETVNEQLGILL